jgi:hypothetical protein
MIRLRKIILIAEILKFDLIKIFLFICLFLSTVLFLTSKLNYDSEKIMTYFIKYSAN